MKIIFSGWFYLVLFWYFFFGQKFIMSNFKGISYQKVFLVKILSIITRNTSIENTPIWSSNVTCVVPSQRQNTHWGNTSDAATATVCERGRNVGSVINLSIKRNSSRNTSVMFTTDWSLSTVKFVSSSSKGYIRL